jgi:DNA-binding MarR family transcriptional regulator
VSETRLRVSEPASPASDRASQASARPELGGALHRAWMGYQHRLDQEMAAAGFDRRPPGGRVLRLCADPEGVTISWIGRELGITRQGAAEIVNSLVTRDYLEISSWQTTGREKAVRLTARAHGYLTAHRAAARRIEDDLRAALGPEAFDSLGLLLDPLGTDGDERVIDYLCRRATSSDQAKVAVRTGMARGRAMTAVDASAGRRLGLSR